jgi:hypothetical protein
VVVDDGSPLPVGPLVPEDPRLRLVRHDGNRGLGAALNYPARLSTLVAAGVPVLQRDNSGHVVATQTLLRERDIGLPSPHRLRCARWRALLKTSTEIGTDSCGDGAHL